MMRLAAKIAMWIGVGVGSVVALFVLASWIANRAFAPEFCEGCGKPSPFLLTIRKPQVLRLCPQCVDRLAASRGWEAQSVGVDPRPDYHK